MAYNKRNKLMRILDVQKRFKEHYLPGMTIEYVYKTYIHPEFKISRTTFYEWIKTPAESLLKEIDSKSKPAYKQASMGFEAPN